MDKDRTNEEFSCYNHERHRLTIRPDLGVGRRRQVKAKHVGKRCSFSNMAQLVGVRAFQTTVKEKAVGKRRLTQCGYSTTQRKKKGTGLSNPGKHSTKENRKTAYERRRVEWGRGGRRRKPEEGSQEIRTISNMRLFLKSLCGTGRNSFLLPSF